MVKRGILFGTYDTVLHGKWTLTEWELSDPAMVTNYVEVPGRRKGPLDLSTALTDGDPVYGSRTLTATFESSEDSRLEREDRINIMRNWLDGWRMDIVLPDDELHYLSGRVSVKRLYNDLAHASVQVTAVCEPWRYNKEETRVVRVGAETGQPWWVAIRGRVVVLAVMVVTNAEVLLAVDGYSWALSAGAYELPDMLVPTGGKTVTYSGAGTLTFTYREAVL